jgi:ferredoxin-NADP reductase
MHHESKHHAAKPSSHRHERHYVPSRRRKPLERARGPAATVHFDSVPPFVTVPIARTTPATPRSTLLTLDMRDVPFTFKAGQAIVIGDHRQTVRRPYSIACSPEQAAVAHALELLVAVDAAGTGGAHLPSLAPGTTIDVEGPVGTFIFPDVLEQQHVLFVGGGTGIAPLRAMMDHVVRAHRAAKVALLYSARRADEFAFIDELRAHAASGRLELHQTVTRDDEEWQGERGRIGRAHFEAALHEPANTLCFVCGPPAMVTESVATLTGLGVDPSAIRIEQWNAK